MGMRSPQTPSLGGEREKKICRKSSSAGGKTPKLEEKHQTCPQEGRLWCDPKVKLSALTGVVGIQIDPGGGKLCLSACVKPVNEI